MTTKHVFTRFVAVAGSLLLVLAPQVTRASGGSHFAPASGAVPVTVNGPSVVLNVTTAGQPADATFTGKVGQRIAVVINGASTSNNGCKSVTLIDPNLITVGGGSGCGDANAVSFGPVNLTVAGKYIARFALDSTATGHGTLWVSAPVKVGTITVNGASRTLNVTRVGQGVIRIFTGAVGQRIAVVINLVTTSDNGCETLTLFDPNGGTVVSRSGCGNGNPIGLGPADLTVAGTYQVRLEVDTTATGNSKLWTSAPITLTPVTVNGPSLSMDVTRVGQGVIRTFTGTVGQRIAAVVNTVTTSDNGCETLTVFDPNGGSMVSRSACGNGNPIGDGPVDLTLAGTYQVRFEVDTTATGSSALWVSAPVNLGAVTVNGPSLSMNVTRFGQGVIRTFTGNVGDRVALVANAITTSDGGCETLAVFDPNGASVSIHSSCGNGNPIGDGPANLSVAGTYQVRFEVDTTATGSSTLWASTPTTIGTVTPNGPAVSMNVTRVGQGVIRTFSGTAGQHISGAISSVTTSDNGCETLALFAPDGITVLSSGSACGNGNPVSFGAATLPTTGTYQIRLEVDTTATGGGNMTVTAT